MPTLVDGRSGNIARAEAPSAGYRLVFDDHRDAPRGFGLRISSTGTKVFFLRYTVDGRRKHKTIGDWPA